MENKIPNPDPRGEYERVCPYCFEIFVADNMNRIYCPEKNGLQEYCKHRMVRIRRNEEKIEEEKHKKNEIQMKKELPDTIHEEKKENINEKLKRNIYLIEFYLEKKESVEVEIETLLKYGFTFEAHSGLEKIKDSSLKIVNYGNYGLAWTQLNNVTLTHLKNLLWTSQQ